MVDKPQDDGGTASLQSDKEDAENTGLDNYKPHDGDPAPPQSDKDEDTENTGLDNYNPDDRQEAPKSSSVNINFNINITDLNEGGIIFSKKLFAQLFTGYTA